MKTTLRVSNRRSTRQRGNALVEFALMSTLLLMTTLGVVDLGRSFNMATAATSAAAAGTAYAAVSPAHYSDFSGMQTAALNDLTNITGATAVASRTCRCDVGGVAVSCPADCATGAPQTYVQVDVNIPFTGIAKIPWIPENFAIKGRSVIRVQ